MKPLKLSMGAFGPYGGVQSLDFNELGNRSIFLIHGPTGSGKTTILDGICFALYGDTSGEERNSKNMRSHHASMEQVTEVIFDFEIKAKKYRISRKPEQERMKKSGTGTTIQIPEATLWKLTDDGELLIQTGWKNVTDEVEKLIGFKSSQFRQVIMLPQGEFRKLLLADSTERQKILERLFKTEYYRKIEEILKESAKELRDTIKDREKQKKWYLEQAQCETIKDLQDMIGSYEKEIEDMRAGLKGKIDHAKEAQERLILGKEGNQRIHERERSMEALASLKASIPEIDKKREELSLAKKAVTLEETEKSTRLRSEDKKKCEKDLDIAAKTLEEARKTQELAQNQLIAQKEREKEREKAQLKVIELQGYIDKVQQLEKTKKNLEILRKDVAKVEQEKESLGKKLAELAATIEQKREMAEDAKTHGIKLPIYEASYKELERVTKKRNQWELLLKQMEAVSKSHDVALKSYEKSERDYMGIKKELFELHGAWNNGQAAILAKTLGEDMPCPVCGSTHHPSLAQTQDWIPSEDEMVEKQNLLEKIEKEKDLLKDGLNKRYLEKEKIKNELHVLEEELLENKDKELGLLERAMEKARSEWEGARHKAIKIEEIQRDLLKLLEEEKSTKKGMEILEEQIKQKNRTCQNEEGLLAGMEKSIPENIKDMKGLNAALKQAQSLWDQLNMDFEKAKTAFDRASNKLTAAQTSWGNAKEALADANEKYGIERNEFSEKLKIAGFETYNDYHNGKKDQNTMDDLEKEIKEFEGSLRSVEDQYQRAIKASEGIIKVELEKLQEALELAQNQRDEAIKMENTLSEKTKNFKELLMEVVKLDGFITEKEEEYRVVGYLSDISNGANVHGLTFQRYVLGSLLDDITIAATERLRLMSKGRYHLRRTLDRARKNAAGGLELEVFDTYTGIERPVSTLSGGETFLASLSLALGLADVVQSYSGGISLDTIFVDEGFGTLDPESLDFAMKTLIDLQNGGRLVGIISHVPELKERIDARLEVYKGDNGSIASFKIS